MLLAELVLVAIAVKFITCQIVSDIGVEYCVAINHTYFICSKHSILHDQ